MAEQQREFFRILYPPADRPSITYLDQKSVVLDLSEGGVRVAADPKVLARLQVGTSIIGTITFKDGGQVPVAGTIIRVGADFFILQTPEGVSLSRMVQEQRILINKYAAAKE